MSVEHKIGFCTLCRSRCGTINTVENGRLVAVSAAPGHPTGKATCPKGRAAPEIAHSARRLRTPLRRTNPKTDPDPGWEEISWDEALDEIAAKFLKIREESGAEAVACAISSPSGTAMSDSFDWLERMMRLFGTPNVCTGTEICNWHKDTAHTFTFGGPPGMPMADFAHSDLIILWGYNPANSWLTHATEVAEAKARGAKLIVVDPRKSGLAAQADHWLRVRPGADAALALGLARLVIERRGYDEDFLRRWTNAPFLVREDDGTFLRTPEGHYVAWNGAPYAYDPAAAVPAEIAASFHLRGRQMIDGVACRPVFELYEEACAPWTPERVEEVTWVKREDLIAAADALAAADKVSYHAWTGVAQHTNATQMERAIATLYALTGCYDAPGGNLQMTKHPQNRANPPTLLPAGQRPKTLGLAKRPLGPPAQGFVSATDIYNAILTGEPYRIRALIGFGANMVTAHANADIGRRALESLEFHVHCDLFETPTTRFADIVLPSNSFLEREGLRIGFEISAEAEELIQLRPQMVPPQSAARADMEIIFDLAVRLGQGEHFFGGDIDAGWNWMLEPTGVTLDDLRRQPEGIRRPVVQRHRKYAEMGEGGVRGFATPTKRVEFYSERLMKHGYPALPVHVEPTESPLPQAARAGALPLVLTTANNGNYMHGQHRSIASLRRRAREPMAEISPELGRAKGVADGEWLTITTGTGSTRFKAKFNDSMDPRVVCAEYGWWQPNEDLALDGYDALRPTGSNFNLMIPNDAMDPLSGSVPMRSTWCDIAPLQDRPGQRWQGYRDFRVASIAPEAEECVSITLAPDEPAILPDFAPGQHVSVRIDGIPVHGTVSRAYSLSDEAARQDRSSYRITVKCSGEDGIMSRHLTRALSVGDRIEVQLPGGHFRIPVKSSLPVVMVAAGIGITPFMSYLETLVGASDMPEILLHYGNRDGANHAFKARIAELQILLPRLEVVNHYSRPRETDADFDVKGRITAASIGQDWIDRRARFYLCGPEAMLRELKSGLIARGVPSFEIFQEVFTAPPVSVAAATAAPRQVRFARSGRALTWTPGAGSLLDLAEANGMALASGCRTGQCESCLVKLLDGQVDYMGQVEELEPGACLTCRAVPASDITLDC